ncbi:archaeosortase/exosortase family protein [Cytophagaceae bacterium ABcell3]|nr:archaeosortase/exosortase family protein [Cytophagaceae bacterium ABcell3]
MLSVIRNQYLSFKENRALVFLGSVVALYLVWEFLYRTWFISSAISAGLCEILGLTSGFLFSLSGHEVEYANRFLSLNSHKVLYIGSSCNGMEFFGLFACFVIAFPGAIKSKLWFLPAGILFIHLINVIRVQFLVINYYFFESSFDFNHKYTFNFVVYGCTLLIWLWWARKQIQSHAA